MDTATPLSPSIEPQELAALLCSSRPPLLLDVRKTAAYEASPEMLTGAQRCTPDDVETWPGAAGREIIVYCVYGHQVSQTAAEQLRARGFSARYLAGGFRGGEDGVDTPENITRWRATALQKINK